MLKLRFAALITALSLLSLVAPLRTQTLRAQTARGARAADSPLIRELNSYVLTETNFRKYIAAGDNIEAMVKSNPSLKKHLEDADILGDDTKSFDQGAAKLDSRFPELAAAIRKAGLSSREWLVFSMSLFQNSMYVGLKKQGYGDKLPPEVNQANIQFVEQHAQQIKRQMERMQTEKKGEKDDDPDQDHDNQLRF